MPELIETTLEDFRPFSDQQAIKTFYAFLRWINGPESQLETNDCALRAPTSHSDANSHFSLCIYGRVYILYRNLKLNSSAPHVERIAQEFFSALRQVDPEFTKAAGVIGLTLNPTLQTAISQGFWHPDGSFDVAPSDPGFGRHLMVTFWAYGENEDQSFSHLNRVFLNIWDAAQTVSKKVMK